MMTGKVSLKKKVAPKFVRIIIYTILGIIFLPLLFFIILVIFYYTGPAPMTHVAHLSMVDQVNMQVIRPEADAAVQYREAVKQLENSGLDEVCGFWNAVPQTLWNSTEHPELAAFLDTNPGIYNLIEKGSSQRQCLRSIGDIDSTYLELFGSVEKSYDILGRYLLLNLGRAMAEGSPDSRLQALNVALNVIYHLQSKGDRAAIALTMGIEKGVHLIMRQTLSVYTADQRFCQEVRKLYREMDDLSSNSYNLANLAWLSWGRSNIYLFYVDVVNLSSNEDNLLWQAAGMGIYKGICLFYPLRQQLYQFDYCYNLILKQADSDYFSEEYMNIEKQIQDYSAANNKKQIFPFIPKKGVIRDWQEKLNQDRRLNIILAALTQYREEHHQYPETLQALLPDILSQLPIEPITGQPWIYYIDNDEIVIQTADNETNLVSQSSVTFPEPAQLFASLMNTHQRPNSFFTNTQSDLFYVFSN